MSYLTNRPANKISLKGVKLVIRKGVFSPDPKITKSTLMILDNLPEIKNKTLLDMGCGSGIIGIYCALHGARKVVAVDSDKKAITNTNENVKLNKVENVVEVTKSYLFENVKGFFDYIFGNLPISDKPGHWNLGISTVNLMKKFISECKNYIREGGEVYFTWYSDPDTDVAPIKSFLSKERCKFKELTNKKGNRVWYLFRIQF